MREIYLQIEGKQVGPLPADQVKQLFAKGQIQADVLAWQEMNHPMILDNRIAKELVRFALVERDRWLLEVASIQRTNNYNGYSNYVRNIHCLAGDINASPDQLEFWLFNHSLLTP